jgi:hypothetical protein
MTVHVFVPSALVPDAFTPSAGKTPQRVGETSQRPADAGC